VNWTTRALRTAEDLSERNRELFTLTSNLPGMVYRCRNDRDLTMEAVSQGCLALTGYGPDDLVANRTISYGDVIHPEDRGRVWDEVQAALSRREHFQLMYRIVSSGGRVKWVWEQGTGVFSSDGRLLSLEGFVIDISEQKRIRDELRLSEDKFSKIFQASPDWISITTLDEGIFLDVNDGYLKSSGYTRDEVIGHTSLEINVWENPGVRERIVGKIRDAGPAEQRGGQVQDQVRRDEEHPLVCRAHHLRRHRVHPGPGPRHHELQVPRGGARADPEDGGRGQARQHHRP
jgi:PAS domain S-box-containing protein